MPKRRQVFTYVENLGSVEDFGEVYATHLLEFVNNSL